MKIVVWCSVVIGELVGELIWYCYVVVVWV